MLKEKFALIFGLIRRLSVVHSYRMAKRYIRLKNQIKAAWNLLREGTNITMLEENKVKIMTKISLE